MWCGKPHPNVAVEEWSELNDKLGIIREHMKSYPNERDEKYSGRDEDISTEHYVWNMPYFLTDLETWYKELIEKMERRK